MRRIRWFLLLAVVVTFAGGFAVWREWDLAALPTEEDVAVALYGNGHKYVHPFSWPEGRRFVRVGHWDFSVGLGVEGVDTIAFWTSGDWGCPVQARPATEMARLRARFDPDCFASNGIIEVDPTLWWPLPGPNPARSRSTLSWWESWWR